MSERMTGEELANAFAKYVNSLGYSSEDEFVETMMREHRTLQQSAFGLMSKCIKAWAAKAEDEFSYDARNEFTVKTCKEIADKVPQVTGRPPLI